MTFDVILVTSNTMKNRMWMSETSQDGTVSPSEYSLAGKTIKTTRPIKNGINNATLDTIEMMPTAGYGISYYI